jgi:hypothetical protein
LFFSNLNDLENSSLFRLLLIFWEKVCCTWEILKHKKTQKLMKWEEFCKLIQEYRYCKKIHPKKFQKHGNKEQNNQSHPSFSVQVTSLRGYPFTPGERLP